MPIINTFRSNRYLEDFEEFYSTETDIPDVSISQETELPLQEAPLNHRFRLWKWNTARLLQLFKILPR
jgi:hypothetical protein